MEQDTRDTIRILLVDSDVTEAEAVLNIFRDAGHATRGSHVTSQESLEAALAERRPWNLILFSDMPEGLTPGLAIDSITHQGRDIPAIALVDDAEPAEILELTKLGVRAVVSHNNEEHLLLVATREIEGLKIRQQYRRMSVALNESEKQRRMLLDDQVDAIVYVGDGVVRYANPAFLKMVGRANDESLVETHFRDLVAESDQQPVEEFLDNTEDSGQATAVLQCSLMSGDKEQPVRAVIKPTSFEGEFTLSLLVRSETEEAGQKVQQNIDRKNAPDSNTRLYNKQQFQEQLDVAVQRVMAGKGKMTLLCATLDSLKVIHEKHGRQVSQPILMTAAKRLTDHLGDDHFVASWGGGIFMVLLKAEDKKQVQTITGQLIEAMTSEPVAVGEESLSLNISMGAIILTDTSNDQKTLLVRARHAATQAQKQGGNKLCFYQKRKVNVVSSVEKHLAGMVSQALKNDDMHLFYQPVVSLKGAPGEYYEVFLRMTDVRGREHDAASFRAKLEKNPLWNKVDRWQLIQASKELMAKRREGQDTRLIVHVGATAVTDDSFIPWMGVALKAAGIPPQAVAIELSEPNLVKLSKAIPGFFESLKEMGCQTVVSNFGCSLNPLAAIAPLNVDLIKMDPSFTKDLTSEDKGEELQKMIEALSKKQCKIIVPQVESATEMAPLWHSGVDYIQGPLLQIPAKAMTFDFGSDL